MRTLTHERRPPKVATTVAYKAHSMAPSDWSVGGGDWECSRTMNTNDIGFRETRKLRVAVPANAAPGAQALKLLISPVSGTPQTLEVKLAVVSQNT